MKSSVQRDPAGTGPARLLSATIEEENAMKAIYVAVAFVIAMLLFATGCSHKQTGGASSVTNPSNGGVGVSDEPVSPDVVIKNVPDAEVVQMALKATGLKKAETVPFGTEALVY